MFMKNQKHCSVNAVNLTLMVWRQKTITQLTLNTVKNEVATSHSIVSGIDESFSVLISFDVNKVFLTHTLALSYYYVKKLLSCLHSFLKHHFSLAMKVSHGFSSPRIFSASARRRLFAFRVFWLTLRSVGTYDWFR